MNLKDRDVSSRSSSVSRLWSAPAERSGDGALAPGVADSVSYLVSSAYLLKHYNRGAPRRGKAPSPLRSAGALHKVESPEAPSRWLSAWSGRSKADWTVGWHARCPCFRYRGQCRARNRGCDFDQLLGLGEIGDQQLTEKHHVPSCWRQVAALLLTVLLRSGVMLKTRRDDTCWRGLDKGVNFR